MTKNTTPKAPPKKAPAKKNAAAKKPQAPQLPQPQADEKLIQIIATERRRNSDGGYFTTFQAVKKDKKLIDCRFTKDCENQPRVSCMMLVKTKDINIATNRLYPTLWVKHIIALYYFDAEAEEQTQRQQSEVEEAF